MLSGFGSPRKIQLSGVSTAEVLVFSDGWSPEGIAGEEELPRTGFVVYDKAVSRPVYESRPVSQEEINGWIVRKNQILMVELMAAVQAIATVGARKTYV